MAENNNAAKNEAEILQSLVEALEQGAEDAEQSPIILSEAEQLKQHNAELQASNTELQDKLLRAVAESENIRRRGERDLQENAKFAITAFARDLVSVFENLHRATDSITEEMRLNNPHFANLAMGVQMTLKEMEQVFAKYSIKRHYPKGEPFNHQLHQAMSKIEDAHHPEGTVLQVLQAAYTIHDRLLQPALVAVATPPANQPLESNEGEITHVDTKA